MAASKSPRLRLLHFRDEIDGVHETVQGATFADFRDSYVLRRTIERALEIISEAARALPPELLARYPEAPWSAIVALGNVLRHEYQHLDDALLWTSQRSTCRSFALSYCACSKNWQADLPSSAGLSLTPPAAA